MSVVAVFYMIPIFAFFTSDHLAESKGIYYRLADTHQRIEQSRSCDIHLKDEVGVIESPGYPFKYPKYSSCTYTIEKNNPDVCEIKIVFDAFRVYETVNCKHDYLELIDNRGWSYRVCGNMNSGTKKFVYFFPKSKTMTLKFRSTSHSEQGFHMTVRQLRHSCQAPKNVTSSQFSSCDQVVTSRLGRIYSPGYPNGYRSGERCTFTIHRSEPRACQVELDFVRFDLDYSPGCLKDYLLLPDGTKMCGPVLGKRYLSFPDNSQEIMLTFNSVGFGKGFDIKVSQHPGPCIELIKEPEAHQCDQEIRGESGVITSPGYPMSYGPNYYCTYRIWRPNPTVCQLELHFEEFDVGHYNPKSCSTGSFFELPGRRRICQPFTGTKILEATEFQDPVVFHFASDGHSSGKGFKIDVHQIPNTCKEFEKDRPRIPDLLSRCFQEIVTEQGFFVSPKHNIGTGMHDYCEFVVTRSDPSVCAVDIQVSVRSHDVVPCTTNYIELPSGQRLCVGPTAPKRLTFPPGVSSIILHYHGRDGHEFTVIVNQLRNTCGKFSSLISPEASNRWNWKIYPR